MALTGHIYKEIQRKVRTCVIEEGKSPEDCVKEIDMDFELTKDDKQEIMDMAKSIGKR